MLSIYALKPAFQNLLRPFVNFLYRKGITANQITLLAMFTSLGISAFIYFYFNKFSVNYFLLIYPIWMLIRMAFNAIDGMLAREFNQQSNLGAFYNELCDVISDSALFFSLIVFSIINSELLLFMIFLSILSEYSGVMAPLIGKERRYDGPMGKSDRAFWTSLITIILIFSSLFDLSEALLSYTINGLFSAICILLILTTYNRIKNSI
ncbi:CDP-alcohol phosphatidyltransferase [Acinetobacter sp. Ac_877]|uniref:CDP-alcohol phosphatidyltransferase family protein n=1 Tax=Acinetobacter portensis TaxID=1839785 RepID=UPI00128DFF63|nr:CDP-alcohol phosphatidyltransferase family protein [Acinetobacter portensis]MPW42014.1 CDP-alcohol phosphatidyltransferase [Acinetobacter portensis]